MYSWNANLTDTIRVLCNRYMVMYIQNGAIKGNKQTNQKPINIYEKSNVWSHNGIQQMHTKDRNRALLRVELNKYRTRKKEGRQNALLVPWRCKQKITAYWLKLNCESTQLNLYRARIIRLPVKQRFQIVSIRLQCTHITWVSNDFCMRHRSKSRLNMYRFCCSVNRLAITMSERDEIIYRTVKTLKNTNTQLVNRMFV